jgi:hypothetical protein
MTSMNRKWWLALVALLCLAPTSTLAVQNAGKPNNHLRRPVKHFAVPEGGSSLAYVLGAGVMCLGAMLVRSRVAKPKES